MPPPSAAVLLSAIASSCPRLTAEEVLDHCGQRRVKNVRPYVAEDVFVVRRNDEVEWSCKSDSLHGQKPHVTKFTISAGVIHSSCTPCYNG
jgi:hypothetical protein